MVDKMRAIVQALSGEGPLTTLTRGELASAEESLLAELGIYPNDS